MDPTIGPICTAVLLLLTFVVPLIMVLDDKSSHEATHHA